MTARSTIIQCRLTVQEKADFQAAVAASKGELRWRNPYPSEVLHKLIIEFTKKHLPEAVE